jgi:hypothetical protein
MSAEGLTSGGTHRTFSGCQFTYPITTGPTGVSVCMIPKPQQDSQGGTHTGFASSWRVLPGDPFRIVTGP